MPNRCPDPALDLTRMIIEAPRPCQLDGAAADEGPWERSRQRFKIASSGDRSPVRYASRSAPSYSATSWAASPASRADSQGSALSRASSSSSIGSIFGLSGTGGEVKGVDRRHHVVQTVEAIALQPGQVAEDVAGRVAIPRVGEDLGPGGREFGPPDEVANAGQVNPVGVGIHGLSKSFDASSSQGEW